METPWTMMAEVGSLNNSKAPSIRKRFEFQFRREEPPKDSILSCSFAAFSFKCYWSMKLQFYRNNITANDLVLTFQLISIYHSKY